MEPDEECAQKIEQIRARLGEIGRERKVLSDELLRLEQARNGRTEGFLDFDSKEVPGTPDEKIALFESLFVARRDIYPHLWENSHTGKKGYSPVCEPVWENGRRLRPTEIFRRYGSERFQCLDRTVIEEHLRGKHTIGTYAIRRDDSCIFLAADFDGDGWKGDVLSYRDAAASVGVKCLVEISRSGKGAHAWIFFVQPVSAFLARRLGTLVLTRAAAADPDMRLDTYDRFFPNQDTLPKGGFGNLIALPLQGSGRRQGLTEFVDDGLTPMPNQWEALARVRRVSRGEIEAILSSHLGDCNHEENLAEELDERALESLSDDPLKLPTVKEVRVILNEKIHISTAAMPKNLIGPIRALATFPNPVFYEKQRLRFPTYNVPRFIFSGEVYKDRVVLPRGCFEAVKVLFTACGARLEVEDRRMESKRFRIKFTGNLRGGQKQAIAELKQHEIGVLVAPPGSGKTVMACAMIGYWKAPVLILVNRQALLEQWAAQIASFLTIERKSVGQWRSRSRKLGRKVDVAMIQSFANCDDPKRIFRDYGAVIVDECHHVPAVTVEALMKECPCRFILGLTATPKRKDGLERLLYQQCGPIRYYYSEVSEAPFSKKAFIRTTGFTSPSESEAPIALHLMWDALVTDKDRIELITSDIVQTLQERRVPIVLSDRKKHLQELKISVEEKRGELGDVLITLDGSVSGRQRDQRLCRFGQALDQNRSACLFATTSLLGEGFDLPKLDTLFLTTPISYKGRLIQYAGRIHRTTEDKREVRIYDYLDMNSGLTFSMYRKRRVAYRQMGYQIIGDDEMRGWW